MIKKIIFLFIASAIAIIAPAQTAVGAWKLYTPFSGVSDMAQTDTYVYYLSAGSCYRIDKSTLEVGACTTRRPTVSMPTLQARV